MNPDAPTNNVNSYLSAIQQRYPYVQVDPALMTELQRRAGQNSTVNQVLNDAAGYSQVTGGYQSMLNATKVPSLTSADYNNDLTQANNLYNPLTAAQTASNNNTEQTLENQLRQQAQYSSTSAMNNQANNNVDLSGESGQQQQYINQNLGTSLSQAEINNTLSNAQLALQNAQNATGYANTLYGNTANQNLQSAAGGVANLNNTEGAQSSILSNQLATQGQQYGQNTNTASILQSLGMISHYLPAQTLSQIYALLGYTPTNGGT